MTLVGAPLRVSAARALASMDATKAGHDCRDRARHGERCEKKRCEPVPGTARIPRRDAKEDQYRRQQCCGERRSQRVAEEDFRTDADRHRQQDENEERLHDRDSTARHCEAGSMPSPRARACRQV